MKIKPIYWIVGLVVIIFLMKPSFDGAVYSQDSKDCPTIRNQYNQWASEGKICEMEAINYNIYNRCLVAQTDVGDIWDSNLYSSEQCGVLCIDAADCYVCEPDYGYLQKCNPGSRYYYLCNGINWNNNEWCEESSFYTCNDLKSNFLSAVTTWANNPTSTLKSTALQKLVDWATQC